MSFKKVFALFRTYMILMSKYINIFNSLSYMIFILIYFDIKKFRILDISLLYLFLKNHEKSKILMQ